MLLAIELTLATTLLLIRRSAVSGFVWLGLLFSLSCAVAGAQTIDWPTLGFTQAGTNSFYHPVGITHAGDGSQRMFILEQPGHIWIMQSNNVLEQPFLTITDRVLSAGMEQGLLGLAFPPGFSTKKYFYVDYTRQTDGAVAISRFFLSATNSNVGDANSEQPVMVIPKPSPVTTYNNHNAGQLAFGPDGYLYIGVGDGGSEDDPLNNGQNTTNLFGKILRIDVESGAWPYAIPAGNPYVSSSGYAPETWAYGLRNPWRFSFDDQTGDLYIGDVGQSSYEEIDFQPAGSAGGQNYGWRIMEGYSNFDVPPGFTNFSALTLPVAAYPHSLVPTDLSAAVIGGYVYRGPSEPRMDGMYFFGDFEAGWIWGLKQDGTNWQNEVLVSPPQGANHFMISTFGEDDQHNLYLANYFAGVIYQIQDSLATWTPTFLPASGVINSSTVIVSSLTTNAQIHYTTNGANPTLSDPVVSPGGTITVATGITYKAWAWRADLTPSGVASATYTLQVATPVFSPPGPITNGTTISISCATPGATIYYTLDGTTPTNSSPIYAGPFSINAGTTVKAFAVETNYANSAVQSTDFQLIQTATPAFNPPAGALTAGTLISISCSTPGSVIFYTMDGTTPTTNSMEYSGPITFKTNFVLKALGYVNGYNNNSVASGSYTLAQVSAPAFNPVAGTVTNGTVISLYSLTPNSVIYYTLDGSTPTTNSLLYSSPFAIAISSNITIAALATANSYANSINTSKYYLKSLENTVVTTVASGLSFPVGVCVDQNGNLYVANNGSGEISIISPSGESTNFASFNGPIGICIDSAGNLYIGDSNNEIWKLQPDGVVLALAQLDDSILQLALDPGDNIYAGCPGNVQEVTSAGTIVPFANVSGWSAFVGVGVDAATNIYAANSASVWRIAQNGTTVLYAGGNSGYGDGPALSSLFERLYDVAVDASTNVFVTDGSTIRKIGPAGFVSTMAGSPTAGYQNGPGSIALFNFPVGICVDTNGNIFVADANNNCIREISPDTYGIGIADWWQLKYFGRIGIDPNSHPDNNGLNAFEDFWAGLNPTNPASVFKIESATENRNGTQISWDTVSGKSYAVQRSSDLVSWTTIASSILGTGSIMSYTDTIPSRIPEFYRIVVSF